MESFEGTVLRVTFYNEENGFSIFAIKPKGHGDGLLRNQSVALNEIKATGVIPFPIDKGDKLKISGNWENHSKYGKQLKVERVEQCTLTTEDDVVNFLQSRFVKGIGRSLARRIVGHFGMQTISVLDNHAHRLIEVEGIGKKKALSIESSWKEQVDNRESIMTLQSFGLTQWMINAVTNRYGIVKAVEKIRENPYILAWEVKGIGFKKADDIACKMGFAKNNPFRIQAGILYTLDQQAEKEGHCHLPVEGKDDSLSSLASEMLGLPADMVKAQLDPLANGNRIVLEKHPGTGQLLAFDNNLHFREKSIAKNLNRISSCTRSRARKPVPSQVASYEKENNIKFASRQRAAVLGALSGKVSVITGGPGTGKTTILRCLLAIARKNGMDNILLAAPTGRASKRMEEATGHKASTVHRLLQYRPGEGFKFNAGNRLKADMVIIDESSMMDVNIMSDLLQAIPDSAQVVFVGDVNQLPSVGPGNVLNDIIESGKAQVVRLTEVFRQSEDSFIAYNAHLIKDGLNPKLDNQTNDFFFMNSAKDIDNRPLEKGPERAEETRKKIIRAIKRCEKLGYQPSDIQVLTPMRTAGILSADSLNKMLQDHFNPVPGGLLFRENEFRIGDRVMNLRNNYDKDIFNGDHGIVFSITDKKVLTVSFDGKMVDFEYGEMIDLTLSYAMTVHKSQGSEYPVVIMPVSNQHHIMLQRNLIYTGLTRAKEKAVFIGEVQAIATAIRNNKVEKRYTLLRERLAESEDLNLAERFAYLWM